MFCYQALDELNVEEFRHGGANITGFRLVNDSVLTNRAGALTNSFRWQSALSGSRRTISVALCFIRTLLPWPPRKLPVQLHADFY